MKYEHFVLEVEEEEVKINLDSHDGGILLGEQSPAIFHSRELQVAKKHEGAQGY
jgi:hypothetical protein